MFGMHYQNRDAEVAGRRGLPAATPGEFARALLADLLNRSRTLELAYRRVYETSDAPNPADHQEALEDLARVVQLFLEDADEARARGLRARAFYRNDLQQLSADGIQSDDTLQDIGGELVSVSRAWAEG